MVRLNQLFTAALAAVGTSAASAVVDLLPSNFDDIVLKSGKPALVEFFAPWCGHCKKLAPIFDELADTFAAQKDKVTIAKVDADEHKELGRRFGVQGFPTLKWFDGKSDEPTDYKSGRDLESLSAFVTEKAGVKAKGKKAEVSNVEMLTDTSFKSLIGGDRDALVAFTAPWCGRKYTRTKRLRIARANTALQTASPLLRSGRRSPATSAPNPPSSSPKSTAKRPTPKPLHKKLVSNRTRPSTTTLRDPRSPFPTPVDALRMTWSRS